ncbi:radical SAM family heme chaperone HemW [Bifidobacterium polysaccharolyticum]
MRRCGYCDFNTYTASDLGGGASREHYADLAIQEMRMVRDWQTSRGLIEPPVSTIFFGGGTPTILPARDLVRMVGAVADLWGLSSGAEITTEANPDTVDRTYLKQLLRGGINRVSFGMQSAVPSVLATLDRTHTPANVTTDVAAAKDLGLRASVDLIYGTPGEQLEDWRTSLQAALDLGVEHVSAYALTLEPTTKMGRAVRRGQLPAPDDDDEAAKYEMADDMLSEAGLYWYEISNWARPGQESRHNLGYWHNVDWAGIGPGAHSHYRALEGEGTGMAPVEEAWEPEPVSSVSPGFRATGKAAAQEADPGVRWWLSPEPGLGERRARAIRSWDIAHPRDWAAAMDAGHVPWQDAELLGWRQDLEETVMLALRLPEGLGMGRLTKMAGRSADPQILKDLVDQGLLLPVGDRIQVTRRGRLLNDLVIDQVLEAVGIR